MVKTRLLLAFGFALLMLNDFAFMALSGQKELLYADYGFKLAILAAAFLAARHLPPPVAVWRQGGERAAAMMLAIVTAMVLQVDLLADWIDGQVPSWDLFDWPKGIGPWLKALDLSFGLALTAYAEEFLFRRLALSVLPGSLAARVIVSSLLFGLVHWSEGLGSMTAVGLAGAVLALGYVRTGSLMLVVLAHYVVDVILFF